MQLQCIVGFYDFFDSLLQKYLLKEKGVRFLKISSSYIKCLVVALPGSSVKGFSIHVQTYSVNLIILFFASLSIDCNWNSTIRKLCPFFHFTNLIKYLFQYGLIGVYLSLLILIQYCHYFVAMAIKFGCCAFLHVGSCVLLICSHFFFEHCSISCHHSMF